jgi:uncharacterized protein YycO
MRLIFARSHHPISLAIRAWTRSRFSHVAAIMPCGTMVVEAIGGDGVVLTPMSEFKSRYTYTEEAVLHCENEGAAYSFMLSQLGKPYDWLAIWAYVIPRRWDDPHKWICSELIAVASGRFKPSHTASVTPRLIWMVSL